MICGADRIRPAKGFTILEILVVVGIIAILLALLIAVMWRVRSAQRSVQCISNLRQIGSAFQLYVNDNAGHYPAPARANRSWEQMLMRYYRGSFACPADHELFPAVGSSYDWRDTGRPSTTLAGRSLADIKRAGAVLAFEALPGWHAPRKINIVRIDASATTIDDEACFDDLDTAIADRSDTEQ